MEQKTASDGGEVENSERNIDVGDPAQAGDLVEGDVVTPFSDDDDALYEVVEIWREEDSLTDPLRVKLQDSEGNKDVLAGTVCRHSLVETAGDSDDNDESADDESETYNLKVSADTVVNGLKINSKPGENRKVLFRPKVGGSYGEGVLRDVRGLMWDGEAPPQIRPKAFLPDEFAGADYLETRREGKRIAEGEGDDPEEAAEVAAEIWEEDVRRALKEQIVVKPRFPEETKTVYNIEYVDE